MRLLPYIAQALLIQDISLYLAQIKPVVASHIEAYASSGVTEERVLEWILEEELEVVFGLFANQHDHKRWPYRNIYDLARNELDLNKLTKHYIKAPQLYGDNSFIEVRVEGLDLFLWFYEHPKRTGYRRTI